MKCLENLQRTTIPGDIIMQYIKLYQSIGKNNYNYDTLQRDYETIVAKTIEEDTKFFVQYFDTSVSEHRLMMLIERDVAPKNKEEQLVLNVKKAFEKIHKESDTFELLTNEIYDLLNFLYKDLVPEQKLQFEKVKKNSKKVNLLSSNYVSKREQLEQLIQSFNQAKKENQYEVSFIITNFYVDFINMHPFVDKNKEIGLMVLYILLLVHGFEVYEYIGMMQYMVKFKQEFERAVLSASFNWEEGFSETLSIHRFLLRISLYAYDELNEMIRNYVYDMGLNKSNNIENTINKLDDIFSKNDLRKQHPLISDSTIDRTLKRMREEGKIRPIGQGRGAKWMKLYESKHKKVNYAQMDLKI